MEWTIVQGLENAPQARRIREEIFMQEQGFQVEFDEIDPIAYHLLLWQEGEAVATGRLFPKAGDGAVYIVGRVAVRKAWRGRDLGRAVLEQLEQKARQLGAGRIELSAQVQAQGFYEKLGYTASGQPYLDEHCPHIHMEKTV